MHEIISTEFPSFECSKNCRAEYDGYYGMPINMFFVPGETFLTKIIEIIGKLNYIFVVIEYG
jgi:hypothetical protein